MKKALTVAAILAILAVFAISPFAWLRVWRARVSSDGIRVETARVYRNRAGELLIIFRQDPSGPYLLRGTRVGMPNPPSLELPPVVLSRESTMPMAVLGTAKVGSVDPQVSVTAQKLSFVAETGKKIEVVW